MHIRFSHSCAMSELAKISGHAPEAIVDHVATSEKVLGAKGTAWTAFLTFVEAHYSTRTTGTYGETLAAFIKEKGLGRVTASDSVCNPGHSSTVKVFVWELNHKALLAWREARKLTPKGGIYRPYPHGGFGVDRDPQEIDKALSFNMEH